MKNKLEDPIVQLAEVIYKILEDRGELERLPELIKLLESKYDKLPEDIVEVITAVELSAESRKELESWLKKEFSGVRFKFVVKPEILAGIVIRYQDKVLDLSLKYRLNKIKKELKYENW